MFNCFRVRLLFRGNICITDVPAFALLDTANFTEEGHLSTNVHIYNIHTYIYRYMIFILYIYIYTYVFIYTYICVCVFPEKVETPSFRF